MLAPTSSERTDPVQASLGLLHVLTKTPTVDLHFPEDGRFPRERSSRADAEGIANCVDAISRNIDFLRQSGSLSVVPSGKLTLLTKLLPVLVSPAPRIVMITIKGARGQFADREVGLNLVQAMEHFGTLISQANAREALRLFVAETDHRTPPMQRVVDQALGLKAEPASQRNLLLFGIHCCFEDLRQGVDSANAEFGR
jgi:hypothetical protein